MRERERGREENKLREAERSRENVCKRKGESKSVKESEREE